MKSSSPESPPDRVNERRSGSTAAALKSVRHSGSCRTIHHCFGPTRPETRTWSCKDLGLLQASQPTGLVQAVLKARPPFQVQVSRSAGFFLGPFGPPGISFKCFDDTVQLFRGSSEPNSLPCRERAQLRTGTPSGGLKGLFKLVKLGGVSETQWGDYMSHLAGGLRCILQEQEPTRSHSRTQKRANIWQHGRFSRVRDAE